MGCPTFNVGHPGEDSMVLTDYMQIGIKTGIVSLPTPAVLLCRVRIP